MISVIRVGIVFICLSGSVCLYAQPFAEGGRKHVQIDKSTQMLRAYEGNLLVFQSKVSTGRQGKETPNGEFHAASKSLMHYSTLYDNAPMPYSVQINSNYFIHGFSYVPNFPASHGCIRMPVNAARQFYDWISLGTPVEITGSWGASPEERGTVSTARFGQRLLRSSPIAARTRITGGSRSATRVERAIPVVSDEPGYLEMQAVPVAE